MLAFSFAVMPSLIVAALILAIIMGLIGGLFPAVRAVRLPMAVTLRES